MRTRDVTVADYLASHRFQMTRRLFRVLPHGPRCKVCNAPFKGLAPFVPMSNFRASSMNPNMCRACFESLPLGGEEMEIGVLFADVRGYTSLVESMSPSEAAERLDGFYRGAADALIAHDALIDKLAGDQVMALFLPPVMTADACEEMVKAAEELILAVEDFPLGAGAAFGPAFVGNIGPSELAKDFTALGDVVNTAERLEEAAGPGELVLSERVWSAVSGSHPEAERVELELKGKSAPVVAHRIRVVAAY